METLNNEFDNWLPLETRTLRESVTELIRRAIIEDRLEADSELNQAQLAERLGISRGPVREALGRLEQEGLIRNVPYKGVYVTPLSPAYVRELFSLRAVLETFAVGYASELPYPADLSDDLSALEDLVGKMRSAARRSDSLGLAELDLAFHRRLIEMARHELLKKTWMPLEIGVQRCVYTRHQIYSSLDEVIGTHPTLIAAIAERNVEQAKEILHDHIIEAGEMICKVWSESKEAGAEAG